MAHRERDSRRTRPLIDELYSLIVSRLKLNPGGGGTGSSLITWTSVAAGATVNVPAGTGANANVAYKVDNTGASNTFNLPAAGTAVDGQVVRIHGIGATMPNGVTINPGVGNILESPNSPGTLLGTGVGANIQASPGFIVTYSYQLSSNQWLLSA